jgi:hypothetical protein
MLLKTLHSSYENLRVCAEFIEVTNRVGTERVGEFPFILSPIEAFLVFSTEFSSHHRGAERGRSMSGMEILVLCMPGRSTNARQF